MKVRVTRKVTGKGDEFFDRTVFENWEGFKAEVLYVLAPGM